MIICIISNLQMDKLLTFFFIMDNFTVDIFVQETLYAFSNNYFLEDRSELKWLDLSTYYEITFCVNWCPPSMCKIHFLIGLCWGLSWWSLWLDHLLPTLCNRSYNHSHMMTSYTVCLFQYGPYPIPTEYCHVLQV